MGSHLSIRPIGICGIVKENEMNARIASVLAGLCSLVLTTAVLAEPANKVIVTATHTVEYDDASGLFTYSYAFRSDSMSLQEVDFIHLPVRGSVTNIRSPKGWGGGTNIDGSMIIWGADDPAGIIIPPGYIDDGNILPSIYQIKPGVTLGGFSYQSPDPAAETPFYAQGFVKLDVVDESDPNAVYPPVLTLEQDSYSATTVSPAAPKDVYFGGRRPAVDGFLYFVGLQHQDTKVAPVAIDIAFAKNGEVVFTETFKATLNNVDVTRFFKPAADNKRRAVFVLGDGASPLKEGRNVLLTTIEGVVPGTNRRTTDADRIGFQVKK